MNDKLETLTKILNSFKHDMYTSQEDIYKLVKFKYTNFKGDYNG